MESKDDLQLKRLLNEWQVSNAPEGLEQRVLMRRHPWWRALLTAQLRIPIPVVAATVAVMIWLVILALRTSPVAVPSATPPEADLKGFQPVSYVNVRIERSNNAKQ
jgi:hypothetical protein